MPVKLDVQSNDAAISTDAPFKLPSKSTETVLADSLGRRLTVREPSLLEESRLVRSLGEESSNTNYVLLYVMPAAMVVKIDDLEMMFPNSQVEIDMAIQRLGREGMKAVLDHFNAKAATKISGEEELGK